MHSFDELVKDFTDKFDIAHFPQEPANLYEPANYFLSIGGKRIRPVMCLMGNELFGDISSDAYSVAMAIELLHNFTLVHDDIMDNAAVRRGLPTVYAKYGTNTAILSGDVMIFVAYEYLNRIDISYKTRIFNLFNNTSKEVCEGQQWDMDFENRDYVSMDDYFRMIELKTSVLLAASLKMGAIIGKASEGNCNQLYEFGRNLGIAFQLQDDYLDAFGDPGKFGKDIGGDIRQNKKTFLLIHALERSSEENKNKLQRLMKENPPDKVQQVLEIFRSCNTHEWVNTVKLDYLDKALENLENINVLSSRKSSLKELAGFLIKRDY